MRKSFKKSLFAFGIVLIIIFLSACSQLGGDSIPSEDLTLKNLEALSSTKLEATFKSGETVNITNFNPSPLPIGENTDVSFSYNGNSYSSTIKYVITVSGSINNTSQQIMSSSSTNSFTVDDIAKVVLFFGEEYKIAEVENGSFNITIDQESPGGIAFLDKDDNYMGYLSLPDGLDSIPTQAISDESGEIDLGEITFDESGIGEPSKDPFAGIDQDKKSVLEAAGSLFGALVRSPGYIEKMINSNQKITFGLMYFPYGSVIKENGEGLLRDGSQLAVHRFGVGFKPEYDNFKNLTVDYPTGTNLTLKVTQEKIDAGEASPEGVMFAGVGAEEKAHFPGPEIPPTGKYQISSGNDFDFTITMPDIQSDAKDNLVFPVPTFNINNEGIVESIEWEYKNKNGYVLDKPSDIIDNLEIQLGAKVQDNDQLEGSYEWTDHGRIADIKIREVNKTEYEFTDKEIYWEDIGGLNMAYDDIFEVHYVTSYGRENADYSLTTNVEGNGDISVNPQKDKYSLGEDVNFIAEPNNSDNLLGYWEFANREDIKIEPEFTMNMLNDTDITAFFGEKIFIDYFASDEGWSLLNASPDLEEMSIENEELEMRIIDTMTDEEGNDIYINSIAELPLNSSATSLSNSYLLKGDFKLVSDKGAYGIFLGSLDNNTFKFYSLQINESSKKYNLWTYESRDPIASGDISEIVKPEEFNNIAVKRIDDQYSFYLNGELLTTQGLDSSIIDIIGAENFSWEGVNLPAKIRVDNVELLDLPQ